MTDWWLNGGILAADCIGAYQAIGAASYAASLVNLANPGTYDLTAPVGTPGWNASDGWIGGGIAVDTHFETGIIPSYQWTALARVILINNGNNYESNGLFDCIGEGSGYGISIGVYSDNSCRNYYTNKDDYAGGASYDGGSGSGVYGLISGNCYIDDSIVATFTPAYADSITIKLLSCGNFSTYFAGTYQAFAIYNRTLSIGEYLDIWAAISGLPGAPIGYLSNHVAGTNIYVIP